MNRKENWIQETMNSLDNIKRAEANEELLNNAIQRLQKREAKIYPIQPKLVWKIAASIAILIGINIFTLLSQNAINENKNTGANSFATEYFTYINQI